MKAQITCGSHNFMSFECLTLESRFNPRTAVAVAALGSLPRDGIEVPYDDSFMTAVKSAVADQNVRFVAGMFTGSRKRVEELVSPREAGSRLFFQPWWTEDEGTVPDGKGLQEEEEAAVAAEFGIWRRHMRHMVAYPAYVVVLGPCKDVVVPSLWAAPHWPGDLFPRDSIIESRLIYLGDVPRLQRLVIEPQWRRNLIDLGTLKQKVPDMQWWVKGVHQIILWVGTARSGKEATKNSWHKWSQR